MFLIFGTNLLGLVFKNSIDWLSRPISDIPQVFGHRPVGVQRATTKPTFMGAGCENRNFLARFCRVLRTHVVTHQISRRYRFFGVNSKSFRRASNLKLSVKLPVSNSKFSGVT